VHRIETGPLVAHYRARSTFRSVNGDQPLESVAADVSAAVNAVLGVRS
jgi:adenylate kinase family enzyme